MKNTYLFLLSFIGVGTGFLAYKYLNYFPKQLASQIWKSFNTVYPQTHMPPQKNYSIPRYFRLSKLFCMTTFGGIFIFFFVLSHFINNRPEISLWLSIYFSILWLLTLCD